MASTNSLAEGHVASRIGWLRAAVLGANDGVVSTGSLVVGIAASGASKESVLLAGVAALSAGAMSMAAGEYVSVSSQADAERSDLAREARELATQPEAEHNELTAIYVSRGLTPALASQVASALSAKDALQAHARDELGLSTTLAARPLQAAFASAAAFGAGAVMPLVVVSISPRADLAVLVALTSLVSLMVLGAVGGALGKAPLARSIARVTVWGAMAMALTALVGSRFGAAL